MTDAQLVSVPAHLVIGCAEPLVIRATNDFLAGRGIAPGDYLIFDLAATRPRDGAIVLAASYVNPGDGARLWGWSCADLAAAAAAPGALRSYRDGVPLAEPVAVKALVYGVYRRTTIARNHYHIRAAAPGGDGAVLYLLPADTLPPLGTLHAVYVAPALGA